MSKIPDFCIHDDEEISGFFGPVRYLSNFWPSRIEYLGVSYPSTEHAYQAMKWPVEFRNQFVTITASAAKKLGKLAPDLDKETWDSSKYQLMYDLVLLKFSTNKYLRDLLIGTKPKHLEERNSWYDVYWGTDEKGNGQNNLGKILMDIREKL